MYKNVLETGLTPFHNTGVQKRTREVVVSETLELPETEEAMVPNASNARERKYKKFLVEEPTRNAMNARERY